MAVHCRITFFDIEYQMGRSVELPCDSPVDAAVDGLRIFFRRGFFRTDFEALKVEIIGRVEQTLRLSDITVRPHKANAAGAV